jgi:hypothetical protein
VLGGTDPTTALHGYFFLGTIAQFLDELNSRLTTPNSSLTKICSALVNVAAHS